MKITPLLFTVVFLSNGLLSRAEEPLIPEALNRILPLLHGGMKPSEANAIVQSAYPDAQMQNGQWSGQTGYLDFQLNAQYVLSIAAENTRKTHGIVLSDCMLTYLYDWKRKHRLMIGHFQWETLPDAEPKMSISK